MKKNRLSLAIAAAGLTTIVLTGCGGGGGDGASSAGPSPTPATATMSATPALGQFRDAAGSAVKATLYKDGVKYKDGTWNSTTGTATFSGLTGSETNLIVEVEGGEYYNEATGQYVTNTVKMRSVADKVYAGGIAVTPLTHAAAMRLVDIGTDGLPKLKSGKTATDILTENLVEGARWGIINPLVPPALVDDDSKVSSTATPESQKYAVVLAAMAVAATSAGSTPAAMMNDLATDLADGTLDGMSGSTPIASLSYNVTSLTSDYTTTVTSAVTAVQDPANTSLSSLAPTTVNTTVATSDVQESVAAINSAGDAISQAKALFASLRAGVLPYFNALGNGYMQTTLADVDTNFKTLQSSVYGSDVAINALNLATQIVGKKIGDPTAQISPLTFSTNNLFCFDDQNSVTQELYPAGTTFAAGCRFKERIPVANQPDQFDHVVYFVYTDKAALTSTTSASLNETAQFKWTGRIDRYQYADATHTGFTRIIKGVNPGTNAEDLNARQKGGISVSVAYSENVSDPLAQTYNLTMGPVTLAGDIWPVLANTDKATISINATAVLNGTHNSSTGAGNDAGSLKLTGSVKAMSGTTEVARLTFEPSAGSSADMLTGNLAYQGDYWMGGNYVETLTSGSIDTKVTLATSKYEVSGLVKLSNLDGQVELPKTLQFAGTIKDIANNFAIFDGSFSATADYASYDPVQPTSTTNTPTGTATLVGTMKKSATDPGLSVQLVATRASNSTAETYALTYVDNNNKLTVNASWNEATQTGEITNTLSAGIKVTLDDNDPTKDGVVLSGTNKIGKIRNGVVTFVDGTSESLI